jgi:rhamnose transport system ATP-binding protein
VADSHQPAVIASHVSKSFPGVRALRDVSFELEAGEVHGLVGENGAGKSTLVKMIAGAYTPDEGLIEVSGHALHSGDPRAAAAAGVATIYQELTTVPELSAAENVFLGHPPRRLGVVQRRAMRRQFAGIAERVGVELDPKARAGSLSVALRQMLEIMRALAAGRRVLIMDEPTASLGPHEREALYRTVRELRASGHSIIYITHDLDEVLALADRVTVMREGQVVQTRPASEWNAGSLVESMLGRAHRPASTRRVAVSDEDALRVEGLSMPGALRDVDLHVRRGEILGIAGLVGSGRSELLRALAGAEPTAHGRMLVRGQEVSWPRSVRAALARGIALAPEDRKAEGLVLGLSGATNVVLSDLGEVASAGVISRRRVREQARRASERLAFDPKRLSAPAGTLSGGNQQKLVISKWLHRRPDVLLLDEPTRGVDVGAKLELYDHARRLADEGMAIVVVSSELEEVVEVSDRVLVFAQGQAIATLAHGEATVERILALVFRVSDEAA